MATAQSRVTDMTRGDPVRLLLNFSAPLFLSNLLQQFYNLADTALAGHILGDAALAQIGATAALYGLIMNFAFGMNNGLALTVSRLFGAGDDKGVRRATAWMLALAAATAAVLTVVFGRRAPAAAGAAASAGIHHGRCPCLFDPDFIRHPADDGL